MSVARNSIDACSGCQQCVEICPMDVFYFDSAAMKSVMAFPENCQSCAQCYLHCPTDSLTMVHTQYAYSLNSGRALRTPSSTMPESK